MSTFIDLCSQVYTKYGAVAGDLTFDSHRILNDFGRKSVQAVTMHCFLRAVKESNLHEWAMERFESDINELCKCAAAAIQVRISENWGRIYEHLSLFRDEGSHILHLLNSSADEEAYSRYDDELYGLCEEIESRFHNSAFELEYEFIEFLFHYKLISLYLDGRQPVKQHKNIQLITKGVIM